MLIRLPRSPAPRRLKCTLAAFFLLISAAAAVACQLCYEAARQMVTIGQRLDMADRAVLAVPFAGATRFRIVEVVKGKDAVGDVIADPPTGLGEAMAPGSDPCLLVRDPFALQWTSLGTIRAEYADWLRQLVATAFVKGDRPRPTWPSNMQTSSTLSYAGWRQRVALVLSYLENPDPLAAQIAWGELARAPYTVMDVARSRIDAATVGSWLDDPKLASRHAAYALLLGFVGGPDDAARLEQQLEAAWNSHSTTNLASMIGADLELRGPSQVGWVEAMYFADRSRTMPEIEAALLALNVHGNANRTVSRERVIQAYRAFIKERPRMAGFVAQQLADWDYWDATTEYAALLKSNAIKDPASEFAVVNYLQRAASANETRR
ncbi:hypothetical protein [Afipia sp. GAS231]|uniref:hypothetical protein n=1 Tax=Afipia sp. GAS231 TaxID=1882747 RepID=UPI00087C66FA|nr:hypothetical protein [Afipia sp. GAS231]SDN15375.1 hypothetical protein SAMN05444050_0829 [Afipia sp. GAS231]